MRLTTQFIIEEKNSQDGLITTVYLFLEDPNEMGNPKSSGISDSNS